MIVHVSSVGRFHVFDLARQMMRLGHLGKLYTTYPKWKVDGLPPEKVATFPWFFVPKAFLGKLGLCRAERAFNPIVIETFDRWLAKHIEPCDVFHCLSGFGLQAHRAAKKRYGALTVCDRGSSHILYQEEILREEYERWRVPFRPFDRRIVERELQEYEECDLITVPSTFALRSFVERGVPEGKLAKLAYGVDLHMFHPVPKEDNVFRVIYVGAMSLQKGVPYLLEALATLQLPKFEIWLIGGLTDEIKPFFKKYEGRFRYLGVIPQTKLYQYYSQGSVFAIASLQEGLALVQAQAMACGLPVIATKNTGAEDLFTDGIEGFIVPIRSPEAIREKVVYLYEHPEVREEMARAALKRVKSMGGWNEYGKKAAAIYKEALNRHRSGRK